MYKLKKKKWRKTGCPDCLPLYKTSDFLLVNAGKHTMLDCVKPGRVGSYKVIGEGGLTSKSKNVLMRDVSAARRRQPQLKQTINAA